MGRLLGMGGSTIRQIKRDYHCELETSPWGSFHPSAPVHYHGRTVQCTATARGSLGKCLTTVLEQIFGDFFAEDSGPLLLYIALPTSTARACVTNFSLLQGTSGATAHLHAGASASADERLLDCKGTWDALTKLLPQLLSGLKFPIPYQGGTHYGNPAEPPLTSRRDIDLPLATVVSRAEPCGSPYHQLKRKREEEREADRDAKRANQTKWRPNRGPGVGRGRGLRR